MIVLQEVKYYFDLHNLVLWIPLFYSASQVSVLHFFLAGSVCYVSYAAHCAFKSQSFFLLYVMEGLVDLICAVFWKFWEIECSVQHDLSFIIFYHC